MHPSLPSLCLSPFASAVARAFPLFSKMSRKRSAGAASPAPFLCRTVAVYLRVPHETWNSVRTDLAVAAEGIQLAARLVDTPPNILHSSAFVDEAMLVAHALGRGVSVKVIQGEDLAAQGFGGIYGVGKAAAKPPALVVLSHVVGDHRERAMEPAGSAGFDDSSASAMPTGQEGPVGSVCFVGKGIVYDTGGLSIKTKTGMVREISRCVKLF